MNPIVRWLALLAFAVLSTTAWAEEDPVTVFAAISMKDALEAAAQAYQAAAEGPPVVFSFAASSVLARQIEAGAPADLFISADAAWMDWLAERGLIEAESRRAIAGNSLVAVVAPGGAPVADPARLLAGGRFTMGDPAHVPAGVYAKAALDHLGLWEQVRRNAVFGENVRVALELVRRGEVAAALVYASDLSVAPDLESVFTFPADSHPAIVYPAALAAGGDPDALAFLDFLSGEAGQRILAAHGFAPAP